jgi:hypothetical protein
MNKEIIINPDLFSTTKKNKTKRNVGNNAVKRALLKNINNDALTDLELLTEPKPEVNVEPIESEPITKETFGCLKNGTKPTVRQGKQKTVKQYMNFGRHNKTIRVWIKDKQIYKQIDKEMKQLDKHSMSDIREYLIKRNLYKIGSTAPDDVLREIYKNAYLTGNIENKNSDTLIHNYLNEN